MKDPFDKFMLTDEQETWFEKGREHGKKELLRDVNRRIEDYKQKKPEREFDEKTAVLALENRDKKIKGLIEELEYTKKSRDNFDRLLSKCMSAKFQLKGSSKKISLNDLLPNELQAKQVEGSRNYTLAIRTAIEAEIFSFQSKLSEQIRSEIQRCEREHNKTILKEKWDDFDKTICERLEGEKRAYEKILEMLK